MSSTSSYPDIFKLFSPGYAVYNSDNGIVKHVSNPAFQKIIAFSDQAIFILNHSTFQYEFVTENVKNICGFTAEEFIKAGADFTFQRIHPDDLNFLRTVVYPSYVDSLQTLPQSSWTNTRLAHSFRFKKADGSYLQALQHSIPMSVENEKLVLGLIVITDISGFKKDNVVSYQHAVMEKNSLEWKVLKQGHQSNDLFSNRENEVLKLTAMGFSEKAIADKLSLSLYTIKTHRKNMFRKSGTKNSAELVRYGIANFLI